MLELHHESSQLRNNLRRQHRIWMDFYVTIFKVGQTAHYWPVFPVMDMLFHSAGIAATLQFLQAVASTIAVLQRCDIVCFADV